MEKQILVLMFLMVIFQLISIFSNSKFLTRDSELKFYQRRLGEMNEQDANQGMRLFVFILVSLTRIAIIYYAFDVMLNLVK